MRIGCAGFAFDAKVFFSPTVFVKVCAHSIFPRHALSRLDTREMPAMVWYGVLACSAGVCVCVVARALVCCGWCYDMMRLSYVYLALSAIQKRTDTLLLTRARPLAAFVVTPSPCQ